jgi:Tfp pilus assembly protein PilN
MQLFSANEYAVITLGTTGHLRGALLKRNKKKLFVTHLAEVPSDERELSERIGELVKKLDLGADPVLILSHSPNGGFFFSSVTAKMSTAELSSSLVFDAQQQILQMPEDFRMQFSTRKTDNPDELRAGVFVYPTGTLTELFGAVGKRRFRVDEFIYPLLALPVLPPDARVRLPELDGEFYWQGDSFHPTLDRHLPYNRELIATLKKEISFSSRFGKDTDPLYENFVTVLMLAAYAADPDFRHQRHGLAVVPEFMRPRRFRAQLQMAVILAILVVGLIAFSGFKDFLSKFQEYSQFQTQIAAAKARTVQMQTMLKTRDKELKEMTKVMELKAGQRNLLSHIANISNVLPQQVLVMSMRWSESGVDMNLQTAMEDPDLVPYLRNLPMYKISSMQHRQVGDTVVAITLKLEDIAGGKK